MFAIDEVTWPFILAAFEATFDRHKLAVPQMFSHASERATKLTRLGRAFVVVLFEHGAHKLGHRLKDVLHPGSKAVAADWAARHHLVGHLLETVSTYRILTAYVNN